ncbi:unnamed protein product [Lactuca saligna]|uniref:Uncharacterized protein n=1 Tax=Lactuca saligna TaxID=75948 RepID=A0AA35VGS5_LACSI|nr:unnamed protein product [Lactuca saligna]
MYVHWRRERVGDIEAVSECCERRTVRTELPLLGFFASRNSYWSVMWGGVPDDCIVHWHCVGLQRILYVLQSNEVRVYVCVILNLVVELAFLMKEDSATTDGCSIVQPGR